MSALDRVTAFTAARSRARGEGDRIATSGSRPRTVLTLTDVDALASAVRSLEDLHTRLGDTPVDDVNVTYLWEQIESILAEVAS